MENSEYIKLPFVGPSYEDVLKVFNNRLEFLEGIPAVRNVGVGIRTSEKDQQYVIKAFTEAEVDPEQLKHFPREVVDVIAGRQIRVAVDYELRRSLPSARPTFPGRSE